MLCDACWLPLRERVWILLGPLVVFGKCVACRGWFSLRGLADGRMDKFGISGSEVRLTVGQPEEEGDANLGRRYAQKRIGRRRIRVIYNQGAGEAVVTVMLRRTEGGGS